MTTRRHTKPQPVIRADAFTLRHSGIVAGPVRVVQPRLRALGISYQYDNLRHAFKVPRARLDDLLCALELLDGCRVELDMAGWS